MKNLRKFVRWCTLVALAALVVLCVTGAFLGADGARRLFNSVPLIAFWSALACLLVAGLVAVKPLRRSPALFAVHVGPLLVLVGGLIGSRGFHSLRNRLTGGQKVECGYVVLSEGQSSGLVVKRDLQHVAGRLPFRLRLDNFTVEYYEPRDQKWPLVLVQRGERGDEAPWTEIAWEEGRTVSIPVLGVDLTVLEYVPGARPIYGEPGRPAVGIRGPVGEAAELPVAEGEQVTVGATGHTVRITRVAPNHPGSLAGNPPLELQITRAGGEVKTIYLTSRFSTRPRKVDDLELWYVLSLPTGAEPDPRSDVPAMKVRLTRDGSQVEQWLIPREGAAYVGMAVGRLVEAAGDRSGRQPVLYLVRPRGDVKDYRSRLVVLEGQEPVKAAMVAVNDPLHYGGYHIYQDSYDRAGQRYVVFMVRSDSGLYLVYAGFLLLGGGVFWWGWGQPVRRLWLRWRDDDV